MKKLSLMLAAAVLLTGFSAAAQQAKPAVHPTSSTTALDLTRTAFTSDFGYKKYDTVTATVCNAGFIKGKVHSTLFLNLGSTAACDPYKTATVYTTVRSVADGDAYAKSLVGKTMHFKDVFFKRDKDRERYVAYVALSDDRIAYTEGRNYTSLTANRADLVRVDAPVEMTKKIIEEKTPTTSTSDTERTAAGRKGGAASRDTKGGSGFFNWLKSFFE